MDITEAIELRKSVRAFKTDPVPKDTLAEIMEQSLRAPSWANTQPWELAIVAGEPLEEIRKAVNEKIQAGEMMNPDLAAPTGYPEPYDTRRRGVGKGLFEGYKDVFRNWWLVLRCSAIGAFIGFIPGLGGTAANWLAYGHASGTVKNNFIGKGDVRGVIAPEAANNAKDGGAFIPTLIFGIPGSSSMAIFLAGLFILGVRPGLDMVDPDRNLHLLYLMLWSLVIANIIAGILCSVLTRPIAYLSVTKIFYIIPFIMLAVLLGAFQATRNWGDFIALFMFGFLGWLMKRTGWPRPPLLVGFVLDTL